MKKIMFSDEFMLTKAVLEGRKTQTRRIVPKRVLDHIKQFQEEYYDATFDKLEDVELLTHYFLTERRGKLPYNIGEVVAVAQSYCSIAEELEHSNNATCAAHYEKNVQKASEYISWMEHPGFNNKMFVAPSLMPHQIHITNVRVERLQDISDEDCLKEGITDMGAGGSLRYSFTENVKQTTGDTIAFSNNFAAAKEAFAHLINKVSRKDVWQENPYVFVYDFELVK